MNTVAVEAGTQAATQAATQASAYSGPGWGSLLWFLLIIAAIPLLLWLLKRTPLGGAGGTAVAGAAARPLGQLALSAQHKLVTVEVGQGEDRRWLVLGVTPQHITTLHSMAPQGHSGTAMGHAAAGPGGTASAPGFATLLSALRPPRQS